MKKLFVKPVTTVATAPAFARRRLASVRSRSAPCIERLEDRRLLSVSATNSLFYTQVNLVSDGAIPAQTTDPNLVNAWGLAQAPNGNFWIADNGTGLSTVYNRFGQIQPIVVTIPAAAGNTTGANPTGMVHNDQAGFKVTNGTKRAKSQFIFVSEDGTISAWAPTVDATHAIAVVSDPTAVFKGVTQAKRQGEGLLFATDFHNGKVDVFDRHFAAVTNLPGTFTDPNLPAGFAPFNIKLIGNHLFVTFAQQDATAHDDVAGPGNGFVDEFNKGGVLIRRFASNGTLNSPWGMALAPASFGQFGGSFLVGNFGDGHINAFNPATGDFLGQLSSAANTPVVIDGLWTLHFGNGTGGIRNSLFFTAGPNGEANGLFGRLRPTPPATAPLGASVHGLSSTLSTPSSATSDVGGLLNSSHSLLA